MLCKRNRTSPSTNRTRNRDAQQTIKITRNPILAARHLGSLGCVFDGRECASARCCSRRYTGAEEVRCPLPLVSVESFIPIPELSCDPLRCQNILSAAGSVLPDNHFFFELD